MTNPATPERRDEDPVDWRRTADGVRLFDPDNADAWIEVTFEAGVPPEKRLFMVCDDCGAVAPQRTRPGRGAICGDCGTEHTHEPRQPRERARE
jgi:hypothetical protein